MIVDPNAPPQITVEEKLKNKGRVHTGFYNNFLTSVPDDTTIYWSIISRNIENKNILYCGTYGIRVFLCIIG